MPSGYTVLIDVGEDDSKKPSKNAQYIAGRLRTILGKKPVINMLVVSHHHFDHIGSVGKGGIWYLIEKEGIEVKQILDRNGGFWKGLLRFIFFFFF